MEVKIAQTKDDLIDHYLIRRDVFVTEQNISLEEEYDFIEKECIVFLVKKDEISIGTARLRILHGAGKIERVCILKPYRNIGAGQILMEAMENYCLTHGVKSLLLGAQKHALGFYEKCGFEVCGTMYMDAGIPHYPMKKES